MQLKEEQLKQIKQFGMLSYPPRKICVLLSIKDVTSFLREFNNPDSKIFTEYQLGKELANLAIDKELFEQAKKGGIDELETLQKKQRQAKIDELKKELFNV